MGASWPWGAAGESEDPEVTWRGLRQQWSSVPTFWAVLWSCLKAGHSFPFEGVLLPYQEEERLVPRDGVHLGMSLQEHT